MGTGVARSERVVWRAYKRLLTLLTVPLVTNRLLETDARRTRPAGRMRVLALVRRSFVATRTIETASGFLEHLTIAERILAVPDGVEGVVVECGSYKGGSTASLSLACGLSGRKLHVFDSFAGLPEPAAEDRVHVLSVCGVAHTYERGMYAANLDEVRANVGRVGLLDSCVFHPGFFSETLSGFDLPTAVAFVDVDLVESLELCVRAIWPRLLPNGTLFVHEAEHDAVARFFARDEWWERELGCSAPGLVGAGSGLGLEPRDGYWRSSLGFAVKPTDASAVPHVRG